MWIIIVQIPGSQFFTPFWCGSFQSRFIPVERLQMATRFCNQPRSQSLSPLPPLDFLQKDSFFQRPRKAEKRDPGNEVDFVMWKLRFWKFKATKRGFMSDREGPLILSVSFLCRFISLLIYIYTIVISKSNQSTCGFNFHSKYAKTS